MLLFPINHIHMVFLRRYIENFWEFSLTTYVSPKCHKYCQMHNSYFCLSNLVTYFSNFMQTKGSTVSVDNKMLSKMNKIFLTNNEIDFMPTIWQEFNLEHFGCIWWPNIWWKNYNFSNFWRPVDTSLQKILKKFCPWSYFMLTKIPCMWHLKDTKFFDILMYMKSNLD